MKLKRPARPTHGVNITSLCDIMLCLLIFFMLVSKRGMEGIDYTIELPQSLVGLNIEDIGNTLTVNVYPGIGEEPELAVMGGFPRISDGGFRTMLQAGRRGNPNFQVIIRAPEDLDYRFLEPVLIACAEAEVPKVSFATRQPG